ncbi:MAG: hypothetical protein A2287_08940 [Candidatus Melainabacteria bacterium RIFOXYA12_FULL_32_12]|nr:MAG: hypothetical protein A2255_10410 [Candidatus Melainabacteria bacterium RIFOXYA2_FULL_32_9]OGI31096.1 MAG: hypothetical protein A2287_08940 [Candidatus Melainabacteria bacterium RIFOXYA12_FULL_32_12]
MKKKKYNIFKTFDMFNSEAMNIIKERLIKFVLIEADNFMGKSHSVTTDISSDNSIQLSILNNKKLYNLLNNTWQRKQQKVENENNKCGIHN